MCLTFIIFQSILKRWGYSWDRIGWKGRLVVGLISLAMFVVPVKILHMKWMRMREENLFKERLHRAEIEREQVIQLNIFGFIDYLTFLITANEYIF